MFAALSDRTRLRLLNLMNGREVCVCYFVEILAPKPAEDFEASGVPAQRRNREALGARENGCTTGLTAGGCGGSLDSRYYA